MKIWISKISYQKRRAIFSFLFVLPWIVGFVLFSLKPIYDLFTYSFSRTHFLPDASIQLDYVGLGNYDTILITETTFITNLLDYLSQIALMLPAIVVGLSFHEFGHASACCYYNLPPGAIGICVYLNMLVFYADVSNVWHLSRGKRIVVNLGGVYFQMLLLIPIYIVYNITRNDLLAYILLSFNLNFIFFILTCAKKVSSTLCIVSSASLGKVVVRSLPSCIIPSLPATSRSCILSSRYCSSGLYCFSGCQCSPGISFKTYLTGISRYSPVFPQMRSTGSLFHISFHN